jgi:pimeloyl-ACP methyl ester carboxylesterase/1-acyl-sn-glycerol-3-phosphate acyltransferase
LSVEEKGSSNGAAANGASRIRDTILQESKHTNGATAVYDQDPPGPRSVHNYMEQVPFFLNDDGGPPRWFSPVTPAPPADAPSLLFLPGMDGTGLGMILHYESLGRLFNMQCLHVPVRDRTPFIGLLKIAEEAVLAEAARRPNSPIYLVGDSFGGSLSLAVAARNPKIDLVLILANPATSFDRSQLRPLFPLLQAAPSQWFAAVPYLLSFIMGDPIKMAEARVKMSDSAAERAVQLQESLLSLLPTLPTLADVVPKDALVWKLDLLHEAALFTNSRLHAVRAQVLILASGKDRMLPSAEEARRLKKILPNSKVRYFKDSGHTLLLEGGLNLANVIEGAGFYRRGRTRDVVTDFVVPTMDEFDAAYEKNAKLVWQATSPVFFSTTADGEVQQGLHNIPNDRPVLFVGNHMYFGLDMTLIIYKVFKERGLMIRGLAHPVLFLDNFESDLQEPTMSDLYRAFGAVPVSGKTMFKLLQKGYSTLLYPGGAREALHRKGEAHKIFWPERSEFVRMAARFGCTIVPISTVGEDDIVNILLDINDIRRIPTLEERVSVPAINIRSNLTEEVGDQPVHFPFAAPNLTPGRLYVKFGKPIITAGKEKELQQDKEQAQIVYKHVQGEVERGIEYLLWKREEDPYREFAPRILYEQTGGGDRQAPTFKV